MWSIEPDKVMFEVTESAVMLEPEHSLEVLKNLTELGLDLSIDDFGTGYSSLAYLKHLPVAELKIDKSFVLAMSQNEDDKIIARTIIELGHNFNLSVIAEGVEDKETMTELASLGCDKGQGYYMSRPVTESELYEFIQSSEWKLKPDDTGDSVIG
jgi:EAL domain-containing protein (putative c-di-GMP-specific phosphodiesterase class I)